MVEVLDGTQNEWGWAEEWLGSNAILAVSIAVCRAAAATSGIPLYWRRKIAMSEPGAERVARSGGPYLGGQSYQTLKYYR